MAGLGDLLGGYGSEDDEQEHSEGETSDPNATGAVRLLQGTSPASSMQSTDREAAQLDSLQPHVLSGPAANPEPPPEGLSPPLQHSEELALSPASQLLNAMYVLPPELREPPPGEPNPELAAKVQKFLDIKAQTGHTVMDRLRGMREWNNPNFLEKMVDHFQLDPYGSRFPKDVWDPSSLPPEDTWQELSATLKRMEDKRAAERAKRAAVAFAPGGVQMPPLLGTGGLNPAVAAAAAAAAAAGGSAGLPQRAPKGPGLPRAQASSDAQRAALLVAQAAAKAQAIVTAGQKGGSKWDAPANR